MVFTQWSHKAAVHLWRLEKTWNRSSKHFLWRLAKVLVKVSINEKVFKKTIKLTIVPFWDRIWYPILEVKLLIQTFSPKIFFALFSYKRFFAERCSLYILYQKSILSLIFFFEKAQKANLSLSLHTHTHFFSLSLFFTLKRTHTHIRMDTHARTDIHTRTFSLSLSWADGFCLFRLSGRIGSWRERQATDFKRPLDTF